MSPSPIRYHGSWKIQKRLSEPDRWLDELGLYRKHIAKDSSCLFRAVSEGVYKTQRYYYKVRKDCVKFMAANKHLFEGSLNCPFENYLTEMSTPSEWGGFNEITAMSHLYRRDFVIFDTTKGPQRKICNGYGNNICLFYFPESKHFDIVYTKEFIVSSSFCQSVMYEILYEGVYQIKDLSYAIEKMLHDKIPGTHFEYIMSSNVDRRRKQKEQTRERAKIFIATTNDKDKNNNTVTLQCKHYMEDVEHQGVLKESLSIFVLNRNLIHLENVCINCLDVNSAKDLLDNNIIPFPYKVAKALDPGIYRNIEFDVWSELRRELRYGARYSDGTTLQVGVKCLCKLQPNQTIPYHCHIQEMRPDGGPCLVFIEETGEKRVVNYEQLQPLPSDEVRPWAPPYRYSRAHSQFLTLTQMLKHIGNISRKQSMYKRNKSNNEEPMSSEIKIGFRSKLMWKKDAPAITDTPQQYIDEDINFPTILHDSEPMPLEAEAETLVMVDCRQVAGAPPQASHEAQHAPTNGSTQPENQNPATGLTMSSGEMNALVPSQAGGRASTPAAPNAMYGAYGVGAMGGGYVYGGMNRVMWCAPPHPTPPPPGVNVHVFKSLQANGADLPMNDIPTLRFYFNLGVECMWSAYGAQPPPRYAAPRDLAQDMQNLSLQNASKAAHDKPPPAPKAAQRPLLGPRFKRGPHHDQKTYNNKGANNNNRRNSHDGRPNFPQEGAPAMGGGECVLEPPMVALPYISYPPPVYPVPYYPIEAEQCMMGGVGYMPYEEGMEYGAPMPQYYPPPQYVPHAPPQAPHHPQGDHK